MAVFRVRTHSGCLACSSAAINDGLVIIVWLPSGEIHAAGVPRDRCTTIDGARQAACGGFSQAARPRRDCWHRPFAGGTRDSQEGAPTVD
jgi:hypothetical protein